MTHRSLIRLWCHVPVRMSAIRDRSTPRNDLRAARVHRIPVTEERLTMPVYKAPVDDVMFLLNDVFHVERYANLPGFADASADVIEAVLGEAAKFCEQVLTPLNRVGDKEGCKRAPDGSVTTPSGFKDAFRLIVDGGWIGISSPSDYGGKGLQMIMTQLVNEFMSSPYLSYAMYPGLTQDAIAALIAHGNDELKKQYLPKMIAGEWTGTMNLTEPH